jgi:glutamate-1-semialdehyde aminotransferase
MTVADFTSTGSKRPELLFGTELLDMPQRMVRSRGCMVQATDGREYLDFLMGLGAVALGYNHPSVNAAAIDAIDRGTIGPLSPQDEEELAGELAAIMPWLEQVRFLKTGAEAMAAAVRIGRTATRRELVIGCGYHGWLDWCSPALGVPETSRALFSMIPFNDPEAARDAIRSAGDRLACVVIEPVIDGAPSVEWLQTLRGETERAGALLIFDEVKTAFRIARGGAAERWGVMPDLMVVGKALANGFPLAAVGGRRDVMRHAGRTWISSTMATEFVALGAARACLAVMASGEVVSHLATIGKRLFDGLQRLAERHADRGIRVAGIPEMCYLRYDDDAISQHVAAECARHGLLFKRTAYNFVSLAHDADTVDRALAVLNDVLATC